MKILLLTRPVMCPVIIISPLTFCINDPSCFIVVVHHIMTDNATPTGQYTYTYYYSRYAGLYTSDGAVLPFSPTRQIALFLYSGGYTPGLFALALAQSLPSQLVDVGSLSVSISREQPRVEGKVTVNSMFLGESSVSVKAKLEVMSDIRLRETYESASVLRQDVSIPEKLQYSRDMYITYLDEDLMVVRDGSGIPELLVRKEKDFTRNWGVEPTSIDDELAPGEGE
jgi:hypothetical protein